MAVIVLVLFVGDHPRLFSGYRTQVVNLDAAFTDEAALRHRVEHLLGGQVHRLKVRKVDLVNDTTSVEVRYQLPSPEDESLRTARHVMGSDR